jgi:transcriptional regulator with XRE-family HTH domain
MTERERIGLVIAKLRKDKGYSQQELAERAKITQSNLTRIENGKYSPGLDVLAKIADALDMELGFMDKK